MAIFPKPTTANEVWASAGIISTPPDVKITQGWTVELPPYQYFNWIQNRIDRFIAHVNQLGIAVWDNETEYQANKSYTQGSDGLVYKAKTTNINLDPVNPLNSASWGLAFEPYGSVAVVAANLATLQTNYNTLANIANYPQARTNLSVYSKVEGDARYAFKAGTDTQVFNVANAVDPQHAVPLGQINSLLQQATTTTTGITRYATNSETEIGALATVATTPANTEATYLKKSKNFLDVPDKATARTNLGLTSAATAPAGFFVENASVVGQVAQFATPTAPTGWLACNGAAVSRATYSALFTAIGTLYGVGDGSTTFNLPDCRDEFVRGWTGSSASVGTKFAQSIQSHTHTATTAGSGSHSHSGVITSAGSHSHGASTNTTGDHIHNVALESGGSENLYSVENSSNVDERWVDGSLAMQPAGDHSHTVNITAAGAHTHSITIDTEAAHTHVVTVNATGSSETKPRGIYFLTCIRY